MIHQTLERLSQRWRAASIAAACAVLLTVLALIGWHGVRNAIDGPDATEPSCSWTAHIEHANSDQAGLIRCYLQAIAQHSTSELQSVVRSADNHGPTGFTASDYSHTADARSGQATVTVILNDSDSADATVSIHYADGAYADCQIDLADSTENSSHSRRFSDIGTYPSDANAPQPAAPYVNQAAGYRDGRFVLRRPK